MTTYEPTKRWRAKHPEVKAAERLRYYRQFQKTIGARGNAGLKRKTERLRLETGPLTAN
jgi:hypothetical protein